MEAISQELPLLQNGIWATWVNKGTVMLCRQRTADVKSSQHQCSASIASLSSVTLNMQLYGILHWEPGQEVLQVGVTAYWSP